MRSETGHGAPVAYIATTPRPPAGPPALGGEAGQHLLLAMNESPFGPSPLAAAALTSGLPLLNRYGWPAITTLRAAIAAVHGLSVDQIVCGNGSEDVIDNLIRSYARPGDEVVVPRHSWAGFTQSIRRQGATLVETSLKPDWTADIDAILAAIGPRTRMAFLANPNNPLGTYVPVAEVARLVAGVPPGVVLCLDAAYAELATADDYSAGHEFVADRQNIIVTRTFSKVYGLAGIRVGWAHASTGMASALDSMRQMSVVPRLSEAVATAAVADQAFIADVRQRNSAVREALTRQLTALGLGVMPSQTNFLTVQCPAGQTAGEISTALQAQGIWISSLAGYGLPDWIRITVPLERDVDRLVGALAGLIARQ